MQLKKIFLQGLILAYLLLTLCALSFTLLRWSPLPISIVGYFYGMMAPYQGYSPYNADLSAQGLHPDGTWVFIDLAKYFPVSTGERTYRLNMQTARNRGPEVAKAAYEKFQTALREHEKGHGRDYDEIRLTFDVWPASPAGFEASRLPAFTLHFDPLDLPQ